MADILDAQGRPFRRLPPLGSTEIASSKAISVGTRLMALASNPDRLVRQRGIKVYEDMLDSDPQVKAGIRLKEHAVIAPGIDLVPYDDSAISAEVADFVQYNLDNMIPHLNRVLIRILDGLITGYSVNEKVFHRIPKGRFSGGIGITRVSDKPAATFDFETGNDGKLTRRGVIQFKGTVNQRKLRSDKFLVWSYQKRGANVYGKSDLRPAFPYSFAKTVLKSSWNVALEKYADPILKATVRSGTTPDQREDLLEAIDAVQQRTGIVLPDFVEELSFLQQNPGSVTYVAYERALQYNDRQIGRALLIPDLLSEEGHRVGGKALGETHLQTFVWIVEALGIDITELLNEDYIEPLVNFNYADVPGYPRVQFNRFSRSQRQQLASLIRDFIELEVVEPTEEWIRDWFGIPPRTLETSDSDTIDEMEDSEDES